VPAIEAGKDIYVEWPLGRTATEAKDVLELSKKYKTKLAVVGLQARFSPVIQKIKEVVESERLGKVLSSTFTAQAHYGGGTVVKGFEYSLKLEAGAGVVPIFFGHTGDMIQQGKLTSFSSYTSRYTDLLLLRSPGRI
jgi:predicted dehydrogenase